MTALLLDNEPVHVLMRAGHAKHRIVHAHLEATLHEDLDVAVPTTVRVEAGWDHTDPAAAGINRLRIHDIPLGRTTADGTAVRDPVTSQAAELRAAHGISVAGAHLAAAALQRPGCTVLTSDPDDIVRATSPADVEVVRI